MSRFRQRPMAERLRRFPKGVLVSYLLASSPDLVALETCLDTMARDQELRRLMERHEALTERESVLCWEVRRLSGAQLFRALHDLQRVRQDADRLARRMTTLIHLH